MRMRVMFLMCFVLLLGSFNKAAAFSLKADAGEGPLEEGWVPVYSGLNVNVGGTGVDVTLATGNPTAIEARKPGGSGPLADVEADFYFANNEASSPGADFILTLSNLNAGENYQLLSFHNRSDEDDTTIPRVGVTGATNVKSPRIIVQSHAIMEEPAETRFTATGSDVVIRYYAPRGGCGGCQVFFNGFILNRLDAASAPYPSDGAEGVAPDVELHWTAGEHAASHDVYFGTNRDDVNDANSTVTLGVYKGNYEPNTYDAGELETLELGATYYWRIDEVNDANVWKGTIWSFKIDEGKAYNPKPENYGWMVPEDANLSWSAGILATSHDVYIGTTFKDVNDANNTLPVGLSVYKGNLPVEVNYYNPEEPFKKGRTYYWRIDELSDTTYVKGDVWQFDTEYKEGGRLHLKVDLALPQWEDRNQIVAGSAKEGWWPWYASRWADMYSHDQVWENGSGVKPTDSGIAGTGVHALITTGAEGQGGLHVKGMCRGNLAGDTPPYGEPTGDPIANSWYYAVDWAGEDLGDIFLVLTDLPAGKYELISYHNHWEPCSQETRNCMDCVCGMPPMPSVTANPLPATPLPGAYHWGLPAGTGKGVTAILNAYNVPVSNVYEDENVSKSRIIFETDGSEVLIIYAAGSNDYPDCGRPGREGSRGILNAFELRMIEPPCWDCPLWSLGDVNGDGYVSADDVVPIINDFGKSALANQAADLDKSGYINAADVVPIINNLGAGDGVPCP